MANPTPSMATQRPYSVRLKPLVPPSLYHSSLQKLLERYSSKPSRRLFKFCRLTTKVGLERARRQLTRYLGLLNPQIKADLLQQLFNYRWDTYRQKHRTSLDKDMYDNNMCCTYPEECSGRHNWDLMVPNQEFIMIWRILIGKSPSNLNLLPFLDQYHNNVMVQDMMFPNGPPKGVGWDNKLNLYKGLEDELSKDSKILSNVKQIQLFATYRGHNSVTWGPLLLGMRHLQCLELHFWVGDTFFDVVRAGCDSLRELILYRQRQGRASSDLQHLPPLVSKFKDSLRVLVIDSVDTLFSQKDARELQRAVSSLRFLECLKLEADESPYIHWVNSRYKINSKRLEMCLRKFDSYITVMRNIIRCFNNDVNISLHFDTYVDIDNHKHAFFSHGPPTGGGENTVSHATREIESRELKNDQFHTLMAKFGPRVVKLSSETDIRPEYFVSIFPNLEELEIFSRASRRVQLHSSLTNQSWKNLTRFVMEVDPGFTSASPDYLLVHTLTDLLKASPNLQKIKILASQTGLKVSEYSLILELNKLRSNASHIREIVILSPYRMQNSGLSTKLALWFLKNCPRLELLRDLCSWSGSEADWQSVVDHAKSRGLNIGMADKTKRVSLYTIDYDSEGWIQLDTGHQFELYNNLSDDWEVVEMDNLEDLQVVDAEMMEEN